jgi:HPt (histidine-containing phosphotransfer) domain-containing protein
MIQPSLAPDDSLVIEHGTLDRILSLGGEALRPALLAQLLQDFGRLAGSLSTADGAALERAAHELKGLAATIGARSLAEQAARLDSLAAGSSAAVREAMALGLCRQIDALCALLRARQQASSVA